MVFPAVARTSASGDRGAGATAGALPGLTSACSRRLPASARASLPLPGAAEAQRWYDFRCQEPVKDFLRFHPFFHL